MAEIEKMTVILSSDMAATVRLAVEDGEFTSSSEVVSEALRAWRLKRSVQRQAFSELKAEIGAGLRDVAEGRVRDFDAGRIAERGRVLLSKTSPSA